ncbi:unnamed protein product, partial [Amoebophrya sp. A120]
EILQKIGERFGSHVRNIVQIAEKAVAFGNGDTADRPDFFIMPLCEYEVGHLRLLLRRFSVPLTTW